MRLLVFSLAALSFASALPGPLSLWRRASEDALKARVVTPEEQSGGSGNDRQFAQPVEPARSVKEGWYRLGAVNRLIQTSPYYRTSTVLSLKGTPWHGKMIYMAQEEIGGRPKTWIWMGLGEPPEGPPGKNGLLTVYPADNFYAGTHETMVGAIDALMQLRIQKWKRQEGFSYLNQQNLSNYSQVLFASSTQFVSPYTIKKVAIVLDSTFLQNGTGSGDAKQEKRDGITSIQAAQNPNSSSDKSTQNANQFQTYLDAYEQLQSKASVIIMPFIDEILKGTANSLAYDVALSVYAELTGSPQVVLGPFMRGRNCIEYLEQQYLASINKTNCTVEDIVAKGIHNLSDDDIDLLKWYAVHEELVAQYERAYYNGSAALNAAGLLSPMKTLASYLLPEDSSIAPASFLQIDPATSVKAYFDKASFAASTFNTTSVNVTISM